MNHRKIILPFINFEEDYNKDFEKLSANFEDLGRPALIENINWSEFPQKPDVSFRTAYCDEYLFIKYYVRERENLGRCLRDQDPVYQDSCVEVFLSLDNSPRYYNFEFNLLGTCLAYVGENRSQRQAQDKTVMDKIIRIPSMGRNPVQQRFIGDLSEAPLWTLFVAIPKDAFFLDPIDKFSLSKLRGNFYKCGDNLDPPHYLSWNPIQTESPDFHCPDFFGTIECV